jgi:hypothetical protein
MEIQEKPKFETFAVVEIFGHTVIAGKVTEETVFAQSLVRIDVPKTSRTPAFTKYYHPNAIYSIAPANEEYVNKMAESLNIQPVTTYEHNEVIGQIVREQIQKIQIQLNP